ncbi:SDR family mycofactocin-dependent oxidoreductase [Rhodococcus sp. ACPA4]|uniref:mycofactocin-coupled SDR family oxidoreductase n=1 Tax=Rhodococcus sp. ACPA4 TaxID=2028571 RepID=UPI000BB1255E|nr:mycofactocin-coupled SDR family oxidoreductase [Rhodococcus sp. ACPA4]PBC43113.1 SDR family mycofactocin-dependent oxidoreductase [Rhodococcus sp. ACPA4]
MPQFEGKVALITGAARGQGRAHALALAEGGATIIALDCCSDVETIPYPLARTEDLNETKFLVEEAGSRCITIEVDTRDSTGMRAAVSRSIAEFGRLDICIANAGVVSFGKITDLTDAQWSTMIDINLTGVFNTLRAAAPPMIEQGFGRIITVASMGGRAGTPNLGHYSAAKWGVIGLTKTLALETSGSGITANTVCPGTVSTDMVHNQAMYSLFAPDIDNPTKEQVASRYAGLNPMRVPWSDTSDVTAAVLYLASDQARHVSGTTLEISAGVSARLP